MKKSNMTLSLTHIQAIRIGRLGGLVGGRAKTPAKAGAARINGRKGGRPPGK